MSEKGSLIRQQIVKTANNLFYHQGFNQTSFSDIAQEAGIPKGNFYHYFKTKEDILDCVIEQRQLSIQNMLQNIENETMQPAARVKLFINTLNTSKKGYAQYGCPIGTLISELGKNQQELKQDVSQVLLIIHDWIANQLEQTGIQHRQAIKHSKSILTRIQGAILLSQAFADKTYLQTEFQDLLDYIDNL